MRSVRSRARGLYDPSGAVQGYVGSVEDITRRKQLEVFLDRTGHLAGVGGWELDLGTRRLTWSEQTRRIHEVAPDYEPTVEAAEQFYAPQARPLMAQALKAGMEAGQAWDLELPLTTASGRAIWVRTIGEAQFEGGKAVRLVGAIKDITLERQRAEELLREQALRTQVEHHVAETDRLLNERSQMLDIMAHEVRQPLNNASAALQSAASALTVVDEQHASPRLSRAQSVLSQVLSSIDNTLAVASLLARPDPIERGDTDIDALLTVTIADMPQGQRERIRVQRSTSLRTASMDMSLMRDMPQGQRERIRVQRSTSLRTASMDMSLMRLALRNLLSNALRYSAPGQPVVLHLMDCDEPLALLLDVIDTGPGLPASLLPRLFERAAHRQTGPTSEEAPQRPASGGGLGWACTSCTG